MSIDKRWLFSLVITTQLVFGQDKVLNDFLNLEKIIPLETINIQGSPMKHLITTNVGHKTNLIRSNLDQGFEVANDYSLVSFYEINIITNEVHEGKLLIPLKIRSVLHKQAIVYDLAIDGNELFLILGNKLLIFEKINSLNWEYSHNVKLDNDYEKIHLDGKKIICGRIAPETNEQGFSELQLLLINRSDYTSRTKQNRVFFCPQMTNQKPNNFFEITDKCVYLIQPLSQEIIILDHQLNQTDKITFSQKCFTEASTSDVQFLLSKSQPTEYFGRLRSMIKTASWNWFIHVLDENNLVVIYHCQDENEKPEFRYSILRNIHHSWILHYNGLLDNISEDVITEKNMYLGLFRDIGSKTSFTRNKVLVYKMELATLDHIGKKHSEYLELIKLRSKNEQTVLKMYVFNHTLQQ